MRSRTKLAGVRVALTPRKKCACGLQGLEMKTK